MPMYRAPRLGADADKDRSTSGKGSEQADSGRVHNSINLSDGFTISEMDYHTRIKSNLGNKGLKINRKFTKKDDIYAGIEFEKRTSKISNPDGTTVFEMKDVEVPKDWSQVATDILAQKYLRKKGVPQLDDSGNVKKDQEGKPILGAETSVKQAAHRLAGTWRHWGEEYDYFESEQDAQAFEDEVKRMIVTQVAVPNSPQWFNTGLHWAYGITGEAQGHYYVDPDTGKLTRSEDAYSRPQPHACFIQSVKDDLVNEGGIFDLVTREARLFKYGSGTGTNFSNIRGKGEPLSGGGTSSGLMSFLKVLDSGAGAIQSGGTTRRAAKMVILNADHPEIEEFVEWKVQEEAKVADLVAGSHANYKYLTEIMQLASEGGLDPEQNKALKLKIKEAKQSFVPLNYIKRILLLVEQGMKPEDFSYEKFDTDFRSEAYRTVSGQNSNNSVRVDEKFLKAVEEDAEWNLINRVNGEVHSTLQSRDLWDKIVFSAWSSADPGMQYHTTVNEWNTCPNDGEIIGSNPCSEYMFLDETACNLYQINLIKFYDAEKGKFDTELFEHVVRLCTIILEISVLMSQLPSKPMAVGTYKYRTLGLGYANLGTLLMQMGYPYDSEEGFAVTGAVTSIMGAEAYATSAEMASILGTFERYDANQDHMLRVIRNHRRAAYNHEASEYEGLSVKPRRLQYDEIDQDLVTASQKAWDYAYALGKEYGYRNAHVTCLAPTGTSGLVMDCDTTGIEPDFALVKFKKLVGGGYFKIVNQSLLPALQRLGYPEDQIEAIVDYAVGKKSLNGAPHINREALLKKGFTEEKLAAVEAVLPTVFELKYAFTSWILGEEFITDTLGISKEKLQDSEFDMLIELGFNENQIAEANEYVCGTLTIEGAPFLKKEDYAVFDCANKCGPKGTRFISYQGHLNQMAAAQPFLSGAISKTINMPEEASLDDVEAAYLESWKLMLKATALYRDASKLNQPLNTSADSDDVYAKLFNFEDDEIEKEVTPEEVQKVIYKESSKPYRRRLPDERQSMTHKFVIAGHEGYLTVGLFEDGTPGEVFITMAKEGSTLSGIVNALAVSISLGLQYGVPLETIVRNFSHVRFEPAGITSNKEIPVAKSLIDYIARWMGMKFLDKEKAKQYHNAELVERSYAEGGSNASRLSNSERESVIKFAKSTPTGDSESSSKEDVLMYATEKVDSEHRSMQPREEANTSVDLAEFSRNQQQIAMTKADPDAPLCSSCGSSAMVRNGSCYKCMDCGSTTGCS